MTLCQRMLFERVVESRCCFRDAAEAVPQQIKLMVNAFPAMLSHHARADLPLGNKLDDRLFQIVKFKEDSWLRAKFAVDMQELFNARLKREAYAHRSLIDLFTAKVLPAKAHTFAKKYCRDWFFAHFQHLKVHWLHQEPSRSQQNSFHRDICSRTAVTFFLGARKRSSTKAAQLAIFW